MLTVVQLVLVTFFAAVVLVMFNVVRLIHDKIEVQNTADAAARAATTWLARGMNALSATNHLIGESVSMLVVHQAIAGPHPESDQQLHDTQQNRLAKVRNGLQGAHTELTKYLESPPSEVAQEVVDRWLDAADLAQPFAYETVGQEVRELATVFRAKLVLMAALAQVYHDKIAVLRGLIRNSSDPFAELVSLNQMEAEIEAEYKFLDKIGKHAGKAPFVKTRKTLLNVTLPQLRDYARALQKNVPTLALKAAGRIGEENNTAVELWPAVPRLPVQLDPLARTVDRPVVTSGKPNVLQQVPQDWYGEHTTLEMYERPAAVPKVPISKSQVVKTTQLCRATFPWVNFHRHPVYEVFAQNCPISDAGKIYLDETAAATKELCIDLQRSGGYYDRLSTNSHSARDGSAADRSRDYQGLGLFVLKNATIPDKGFEKWTDKPVDLADQFTMECIARRRRPVLGRLSSLFPERSLDRSSTGPQHVCAVARAIVYNCNPQLPHAKRIDLSTKRIIPARQPMTGWDTLQWSTRQGKQMPYELVAKDSAGQALVPEFPEILLAWNAKLVPITPGIPVQVEESDASVSKNSIPAELALITQTSELVTH